MPRTLQFKRYNTASLSSIRGANGEIIIDTTTKTVTVHDGVTFGGSRLATESYANTISKFTRVVNAGSTSGTLTPNADTTDVFNAFDLTGPITVAAPSGTSADGQRLILRFKDDGTGRAITWNGTYRVVGTTFPIVTVASKITYVGCIYNSTDVFWDVIAVATRV
jgi:hypothetical protein